jgi:hypothetical protein
MSEEAKYIITYFLTSGEHMNVSNTDAQLVITLSKLKSNWNGCCIACEEYGINFTHVTHYRITKEIQ